jgi:hypothetical protein
MDEQNVGGETEFPQGIQLDGTHRFKVARTHAHTRTQTHKRTDARTHAHTHAHARTHTHARTELGGSRRCCHTASALPQHCEYSLVL